MASSSCQSVRNSGKCSMDSTSELHNSSTLHSQSSFGNEFSQKYEQVTSLLATGKPGPDLFAFFSKLQPRTVSLVVPPTLYQTSERPPIALFTNNRGEVDILGKTKYILDSAVDRFFKFASKHSLKYFVYKEDNTVQFCNSPKSAVRMWSGSRSATKQIQVYIAPASLAINKLRVHWTVQNGLTCFQIKRHSPELFAETQAPKPRQQRLYLHKLSEYKYAGKLYKSSFSLSDPCPSVLQQPPSARQTPSRQLSSVSQASDYFVRFHDRDLSVEEVDCPSAVNRMVGELATLLSTVVPHKKSKGLVEFVADFECDHVQKWTFLGCKAYRLDFVGLPQHRAGILPRHNDISSLLISQLKIVAPLEPEDIHERLVHLKKEMNELTAKKRRIFVPRRSAMAFTPSPSKPVSVTKPPLGEFDKYVGRACGKLDCARRRFLVMNSPGRSVVPNLKYQRFCCLLFEALDEHKHLRDYSKNLEKSLQFWSLDSKADLQFVLTYITRRLQLPSTLFPFFLGLVTDLCRTVDFAEEATLFIKDVLTASQQTI